MGAACTAPTQVRDQKETNRRIDKDLKREQINEIGNQKLLLLGTGECGKSTILKQMQILHNNGFTDAEFEDKREVIYSNIVTAMAAVLRALEKFGYELQSADRQMDARRVLSVVESGKDAEPFTPDLFDSLKMLWADQNVIKAYERRSEFQLGDSAKYFFDDLDRIHMPNYRPTVF